MINVTSLNLILFLLLLSTPAPPSMPAAPEVADKTKHSVTLSWKPPERDGGSPIKGYIIQIQDEGKSDWVRVNDPESLHPTTEFTVPSLRALKRHRFRIIAVNDIGESDPSPSTGEVLIEDIQRTCCFNVSLQKMHDSKKYPEVFLCLSLMFPSQFSLDSGTFDHHRCIGRRPTVHSSWRSYQDTCHHQGSPCSQGNLGL